MFRTAIVALALAACEGPGQVAKPDPCHGLVTDVPIAGANHVPEGSPIEWTSNPPTSGAHYPIWAEFDQHYESLQRGYWVHDLEHGAIVYAYRCDAGCPDVAATLDDVVHRLGTDGSCHAPVRQRALVVADPLLPADGTVAAVAWGSYYAAANACADEVTLVDFYNDHAARGPEDTCADGVTFSGTPLY